MNRLLDALTTVIVWTTVPLLVVGYVVVWELAGTGAAIATWLVLGVIAFLAYRRYG